mgnify:CR=1 FL=1
MTSFNSPEITITQPAESVYHFLTNFKNFEKLMPDQVVNWRATEDHCSFTIQGMADLAMHMGEKTPYSFIRYESEGKSPVGFNLEFNIKDRPGNTSQVKIILKANLNPMLKMMASRPLSNFVNLLAEKLKEVMVDRPVN